MKLTATAHAGVMRVVYQPVTSSRSAKALRAAARAQQPSLKLYKSCAAPKASIASRA